MSLKNKFFKEMFSRYFWYSEPNQTQQKLKNLDPTQSMGQPNPPTTLHCI